MSITFPPELLSPVTTSSLSCTFNRTVI